MSAQLEHLRPPVTARPPQETGRAVPAPDAQPAPQAHDPHDPRPAPADRDRGLGLLYSFVGAATIMVGDVVVVGAVEQSWVLIPGFAVLLAMTLIVFRGIMRLLADGGEAPPHGAH